MFRNYKHTKIVATVGPVSSNEEILGSMVLAGVNVFRLNFSHGDHATHLAHISFIRKLAKKHSIPLGILMDLQGPKIRIGKITDENGLALKPGKHLTVTNEDADGTNFTVSTSYSDLIKDVAVGERIFLDDGLLEVVVEESFVNKIICRVVVGGILSSHKGMNLPNTVISSPALTPKDLEDLKFGITNEVDFVALSFVRGMEDILLVKKYIKEMGADTPVIAKIEKPEAVKNIDTIIKHSYGIMVARGDLGVEVDSADVPLIQKEVVDKCNEAGKPVIIATQILDSMIRNPRPTRAEASDVACAVMDGADALMLSGESAAGKYPLPAVKMMNRIIKNIEEKRFIDLRQLRYKERLYDIDGLGDSVAYSTVLLAKNLAAKQIVCITQGGNTAQKIARYKSGIPVFAVTGKRKILRRLSLSWGVACLLIEDVAKAESNANKTIDKVMVRITEKNTNLKSGDLVIITLGLPNLSENSTNTIRVYTIP